MKPSLLATLAAAFIAATAPSVLAVRDATLVDPKLERIPVRFVSLDDGRLSYFDAQRRLTTVEAKQKLALRFDRDPANTPRVTTGDAMHALRLRDATVIRGRMVGVDGAGRLVWKSPILGEVAADLDDIAAFSVDDAAAPKPAIKSASDDVIELTNGDRLSGFVDKLTPEKLVLSINDAPVDLEWSRIARVSLANPIKQSPGTWISLSDGTRVRGDHVRLDESGLAAETADGRQIAAPMLGVRAIEFASDRRLAPIDQAGYEVTSGGEVFGVPMPPIVDGDRVHLHAPVSVSFELPDGANRFATTASLAPADLEWADCVIIVSDDKGELARHRLNAKTPSVDLSVESRSPGGMLRVTVEPGVNGPVRDRVTLSDTVFLVEIEQ